MFYDFSEIGSETEISRSEKKEFSELGAVICTGERESVVLLSAQINLSSILMPMHRTNISSGAPWEAIVGYSRAVRIGTTIEVSGTVAVENDQLIGLHDPYVQTGVILRKIEHVLKQAGASLTDVVRTRIFVTDISQWEAVGRAHGEFFGEIRPCTTMVEVARLIAPEYMVEIEATAVIQEK